MILSGKVACEKTAKAMRHWDIVLLGNFIFGKSWGEKNKFYTQHVTSAEHSKIRR
jgi:hypothetical protein